LDNACIIVEPTFGYKNHFYYEKFLRTLRLILDFARVLLRGAFFWLTARGGEVVRFRWHSRGDWRRSGDAIPALTYKALRATENWKL